MLVNKTSDYILINKVYHKIAPTEEYKIDFDKHITFIKNSDPSKDYYNFHKIKLSFSDHLPLRLGLLLLGPRLYHTLSKRVNNKS